uniref:Uncharacterized protein n=1 Tax=Anguilla anguilla TaxID=7936 RepID=A0A0E9SEE4_ANGAN
MLFIGQVSLHICLGLAYIDPIKEFTTTTPKA